MSIQLLLGDCLEKMKEIPDGSVDMVLCDLPYGTTACKWDAVIPFAPLWEQYRRVCKPNAALVFTASQPFTSALVMSAVDGFKYEVIWEKDKPSDFALAPRRTMKYHESILVFSWGRETYNPQMMLGVPNHSVGKGIRRKTNESGANTSVVTNKTDGWKHPKSVMRFNREPKPVHPTQKPIALMEYLTKTYTNPGELVLDNTMGSGTTGVACVNTGRQFVGIERDETYFKIAQERIESAKSQKPVDTAPQSG